MPVLRGGAAGRSEGKQRISSVAVTALAQLVEDAHIEDVLVPDVCTVAGEETGDSAWFDHSTGVSGVIVDERGNAIEWPWEDQAQERRPTGKRVRHSALDRIIVNGLMHASVKGDMGSEFDRRQALESILRVGRRRIRTCAGGARAAAPQAAGGMAVHALRRFPRRDGVIIA